MRRPGLSLKHKRMTDWKSIIQNTPRDDAEQIGEGESDAQGTGDEEHNTITRGRQGSGPPVKAGREGERA